LIEYSDLECPYCKRFHSFAQKAVDEYKGEVAWVYRHFPLDMLHSKARIEAQATECAAELGGNDGFWTYIDKIFEITPSNNGLDLDKLPKLAGEVGLDSQRFKTCLDSKKYKDRVEKDYQGGTAAGVSATPTSFIVNNKGEAWIIPGAAPFEAFKPAIETALGN
jgi:protein-disulfide isomerase